jgi:Arc/MetJ family transcription regulator
MENLMATNLAIDENLLKKAQKLGKHRTKKETVNTALMEYIKRVEQQKILSLLGTVRYEVPRRYKFGSDTTQNVCCGTKQ